MTEQETNDAAIALFHAIADRIGNLFSRWQHEKEYEDWEDYKKAMHAALFDNAAPGTNPVVVKYSKRPFGLDYMIGTQVWHMTANTRNCTVKRIR